MSPDDYFVVPLQNYSREIEAWSKIERNWALVFLDEARK